MMNLKEMVGIEKMYNYPKLTGDWDNSCSSSDPPDSNSDDYSSLSSFDTISTADSDTSSTADTQILQNTFKCKVGQRFFPKSCVEHGLEYPANPFPVSEFTSCLRADSCMGRFSEYVVLLSSDGHYFIIKRKYAYISKTLAIYFNRTYPYKLNITDFNYRLPSLVVLWVCKYLIYKFYYSKYREILIRPFFPIPPILALDLMIAGYMLKC